MLWNNQSELVRSYRDECERIAMMEHLAKLNDERQRLRRFAEYVLNQISWDNGDLNGGDVQDKAEELGLIELRPIKPEDSIDGETEHYFCVWTPKEG